MKRTVIGALLCALALSASANIAEAAPKKKAQKATTQQEAPQSAEISKAMGDLKWGTDREEVLKKFTDQIREKYKPLIAKATGALEEDKQRAKMRDELAKVRSSVVEFNGNKTGWDASFLKSEFTHHNGESMFVLNDSNSQNYYFFMNNKLWKWYKAFNAEAFQGKKFDEFAAALQGRYGKSQAREGELSPGQGKQRWLEWQDKESRLRAIDNNQFYGFYCLVFEDKETVKRLAELRRNQPDTKGKRNTLVDSVTSGEESGANDGNPDVIDRITGKIRHRQDAPEPGKDAGVKGSSNTASSPSTPAPTKPSVTEDNDPLKGLL